MHTFNRILKYTKSYRLMIFISIITSITYALLNSASIWLIGNMLGNVMNNNNQSLSDTNSIKSQINQFIESMIGNGSSLERLQSLCVLLVIIFISKNILLYISNVIISFVQNKVIMNIRISLFKHINKLSISFFNKTKSSEISSIFIRDITAMRVAFSQSLNKLIIEPVSIISFIILLLIINLKFALISIIIIPLCGYIIIKIGGSIRRKAKRSSIQIAGIMNIIKENINGIKIIKSFNMEKFEEKKFINENMKYFNLMIRQSKLTHLLTPINEMIGLLLGVLLIWFGGIEVLKDNPTMNSEDFIKFILILFAMMQPIRKLANINVQFQNGLAAADRVFSIFDNNEIIPEIKSPKILKKFNNSIIFKNVSFSYSNNEKMTLKNLNTEISKGQTTAIVGKSGSGKSTFADLISRFYDVGNGEILIDQKNIKDYSLESLRKFIGIVTQNIILFDDSIRNNILNGNIVATNEQINSAIKSANLVELISKLPNGIETIIGENGVQLSGGEKQRLSIARALIKNPDILILDEATASLDTTSESNVHGAIEKLLRNRTVIIIAHRLSTIVNADKIIIFEDGKIIEEGNHERLIKESKVYKELYNLKFNEY